MKDKAKPEEAKTEEAKTEDTLEQAGEETLKFMETCKEVELYFQIDAIGGFMWRMKHDMGKGRIPEADCIAINKDIARMSITQQHLVKATERFGVPFKMVETEGFAGKGTTPCDEYWQWYSHWDNWKKDLTDEQWNVVDQQNKASTIPEDILPKKKWNE